jgi:hypothetical protein
LSTTTSLSGRFPALTDSETDQDRKVANKAFATFADNIQKIRKNWQIGSLDLFSLFMSWFSQANE